jgi:hypothetical protein
MVNNTRTFGVRDPRDLPRFSGMHPRDTATDPAGRAWVAEARGRLEPVVAAATRLRVAYEAGADPATVEAMDPASELIGACAGLLEWLHDSPAPSGHAELDAELRAAGGVLRNAAFAFRGLTDADPEQRAARAEACQSMLVQGEHHVDAFRALAAGEDGGPG